MQQYRSSVVGEAYKYLFGTLDEDDREDLEEIINNMSEDSVKPHDLNMIIDVINSGIDSRWKKNRTNKLRYWYSTYSSLQNT